MSSGLHFVSTDHHVVLCNLFQSHPRCLYQLKQEFLSCSLYPVQLETSKTVRYIKEFLEMS